MQPATQSAGVDPSHRRVIFASSLGTVFEWYDFYLYGALSAIISRQFFSGVDETTGYVFALLAFAAGFLSARSVRSSSVVSAISWVANIRF